MNFIEIIGVRLKYLFLPLVCYTYGSLAFISRQMRGAVINSLGQDYVRTAKAKGLSQKVVLWKHAFRNSLLPIITLFANIFPLAISGSIVLEIIFSIPGMGKLAYEAILRRNYPIVFSVVMFSGILTLVGNLVSDILYAVVDPRISYSSKRIKMAKEKIEKNTDSEQAYWSYVKRQFRKNKRALFSAYFVAFLAFIALFADFLANEKPIVAKYQGVTYFPIAKSYSVNLGLSKWQTPLKNINWLDAKYDWAIRPLIPYSPTTVDNFNMQFVGPFDKQSIKSIRWKHWFGTEKIGRDILSGLIHGTRTAFLVGLVSMSIASLIGIILGSLAGFFGDNRLKVSRASAIGMVLSAIFGFFYAFSSRSQTISDSMGVSPIKGLFQLLISVGIFIAVCGIFYLLTRPMKFIPLLNKKTSVPIDIIVQRLIEILLSIPRLFLIIAIVAIAKPSIFLVMIVIGATSWTEIARFIRAELLKVRSLEYIEASRHLGIAIIDFNKTCHSKCTFTRFNNHCLWYCFCHFSRGFFIIYRIGITTRNANLG
ncbi:MAG: ABC transporter permease subunit [Bacteroidetes bacterium]|nr:ABC transporter permease subunit [Bacteroidota bacterium]